MLGCSNRGRYLKILGFVLVALFLMSRMMSNTSPNHTSPNFRIIEEMHVDANFQNVCVLPKVDMYDPEIMKFVRHPKPLVCAKWPDLVYITDDGVLHLNQSAINASGSSNVTCFHQIVRRVTDFKVEIEKAVPLKSPVYIPADFIYVTCKDSKGKQIYGKIHIKADFKTVRQKRKQLQKESETDLSVIMFGVDSLSRISAKRRLPKTMKFLKSLPGTFIFEGYTKVEESTFVNLVPVLTGKQPIPKLVNISSWRVPLDSIPFMWKDFKAKGMPVLYAEDWLQFGTFALQKGFANPIFDHYMRPFFLAVNKVHKINIDHSLCYANSPKIQTIIEYQKKFLAGYDTERTFSFSWINALSHDEPNNLELADAGFMEYFSWLNKTGNLENSVLVFFSDHGPRHSKLRNTVVGRIEDRMPLLAMVFPEKLLVKYPHVQDVLNTNVQRLTTPYDLHETLFNLLNSNFSRQNKFGPTEALPRGISHFREIPLRRSCSDAFIKEMFCSCYTSYPVSITDPGIRSIGEFIVKRINDILSKEKDRCAFLKLKTVESASIINTNNKAKKKPSRSLLDFFSFSNKSRDSNRYLVAVRTTPGDAMFESTVQHHGGDKIEILGDVLRINKFGNQSDCVPERFLKSYCYCLKLLQIPTRSI